MYIDSILKTKGLYTYSYLLTLTMKTINETFEDKEYEELIKIKKDRTWRKFILELAGIKKR